MLLTETIAVTGIGRELSAALSRWRRPLAIHDPAKVMTDLAVTLALGGDCLADIALLVTDLDVKLTATALGMNDAGLVRYLADNVDRDRLTPTNRTTRADPGAPGATLHTLP